MDVDRDSAALFASRVISKIIGFASVAYFTWKIGAAGFGIYVTFRTVKGIAGVLSQFGIPQGVTKRMSQATDVHGRGRVLTAAIALSAVPFAVTVLVFLALEPILASYVELEATVPLALVYIALTTVNQLFVSGLKGEGRVAATAVMEMVSQVIRVAASVALLAVGFRAVGLVYGALMGVTGSVLVGYILLETGIVLAVPSRESVENLFSFSKYTLGMNVSDLAYNWGDTLVLAALASKAIVGVYEIAWQVSLVTLMAAQVIGVTLMPAMTRWHENGAIERIEQTFRTSISFALVLVIPALVGAAIIGEELFRVVYGIDQYAVAGGTVLVALLGGQVTQAVKQITQNTLLGIDRPNHVFWTNLVSLAANIVLNLALIPQFGMLGAAAATVTTTSVAALLQVYYLRQYINVGLDYRTVAWQTFAALAMGAAVYGLGTLVDGQSAVGFAVLVGTGIAVYGLVVVVNGSMRQGLSRARIW